LRCCTLCNALVLFLVAFPIHPTHRVAEMGVDEGKTDPSRWSRTDGQFARSIPQSRRGTAGARYCLGAFRGSMCSRPPDGQSLRSRPDPGPPSPASQRKKTVVKKGDQGESGQGREQRPPGLAARCQGLVWAAEVWWRLKYPTGLSDKKSTSASTAPQRAASAVFVFLDCREPYSVSTAP
jgi:hypothetical protein